MAAGCPRPRVCRVPVFFHMLSGQIVSRKRGSGRIAATAHVCPDHENDLALGAHLQVRGNAVTPLAASSR